MSSSHEHHGQACCDCGARPHAAVGADRSGLWSALVALLACAVCPACIATYAKLLSLAGVGVGVDETAHHLLLAAALMLSVGVSAWRSWRTGRAWPLALAVSGAVLVALGHLLGDVQGLEWAGVLILLIGGLTEHVRLRRRSASSLVVGAN